MVEHTASEVVQSWIALDGQVSFVSVGSTQSFVGEQAVDDRWSVHTVGPFDVAASTNHAALLQISIRVDEHLLVVRTYNFR